MGSGGLPLAAGFVLGAIVSPPDAIAASAIAQRLPVPRRIVTILEGESLVNDATALVAYRFAVVAVSTGSFSLAKASGQFFIVGLGGILIGAAVGWLAERFHRRVDDAPIEITVSLLTPFAAYLGAERLGVSGVLAVVTAGLYLGWRTPEILSYQTRQKQPWSNKDAAIHVTQERYTEAANDTGHQKNEVFNKASQNEPSND